eukprot:TRINITY_DN779_c0_g1_i8.p1 TRINITY_DN779_c0_g1~~TRINITY_DN779_c0_g1_i8.p1  ORF type:complete len:369 (+),score=21.24 TRINITY_DN779_c0_g1_i8:61-1167(+)
MVCNALPLDGGKPVAGDVEAPADDTACSAPPVKTPYMKNFLTALVLSFAGGFLSQLVFEKIPLEALGWRRLMAFTAVGALYTGFATQYVYNMYYAYLPSRIVESKFFPLVTAVLESGVHSPAVYLPVYFAWSGLLQGQPLRSVEGFLRSEWLLTWATTAAFWWPATVLIFFCLPRQYQGRAVSVAGFVWFVVLSFITRPGQETPATPTPSKEATPVLTVVYLTGTVLVLCGLGLRRALHRNADAFDAPAADKAGLTPLGEMDALAPYTPLARCMPLAGDAHSYAPPPMSPAQPESALGASRSFPLATDACSSTRTAVGLLLLSPPASPRGTDAPARNLFRAVGKPAQNSNIAGTPAPERSNLTRLEVL